LSAIVLDASVAVKRVSREPDSDVAVKRVFAATKVIAPDWMMLEVAHGLWKKSRDSSFDRAMVRSGVTMMIQLVDDFVPAVDLLPSALELSFDLPHPLYDCLYLALAIERNCAVLTSDRKFIASAQGGVYRDYLESLA
jgi:predicted nucleic acid-binding protein